MKTIALFNSKSGVGKTTLAFHLTWMLHHLSERVLAVDLDPQADLTAAFLSDEEVELLWTRSRRRPSMARWSRYSSGSAT